MMLRLRLPGLLFRPAPLIRPFEVMQRIVSDGDARCTHAGYAPGSGYYVCASSETGSGYDHDMETYQDHLSLPQMLRQAARLGMRPSGLACLRRSEDVTISVTEIHGRQADG